MSVPWVAGWGPPPLALSHGRLTEGVHPLSGDVGFLPPVFEGLLVPLQLEVGYLVGKVKDSRIGLVAWSSQLAGPVLVVSL